jgi:PncC family amidohydrolase
MTIPHDLKHLCDERNLTLAVAESASAGHLAALITSVSGASTFFEGGVVVYNQKQKVRWLHIDSKHAAKVNCVSDQVAVEMASGVRGQFGTSIGLSITGYAEPDQNGERYAWIGFAVGDTVWAERVEGPEAPWLSMRKDTQEHFAWMALEGLVNYLRDQC